MFKFLKIISICALLSCFPVCYAIQVSVQSSSQGVYALGFSVKGVNYGSSGTSYSKNNMPAGATYSFGIRVGGLMIGAKDIGCAMQSGKTAVKLNKDTSATLIYDQASNKCYMRISSNYIKN